jgi:beta-aspartyl-peptidase (threonine type)
VLKRGGPSLDAVEATIRVLEERIHFSMPAREPSLHTRDERTRRFHHDGGSLKAGAVAAVKRIRNPISLARLVMEKSPHVMLEGDGAEAFARELGIRFVDQKYFYTDERWRRT